MVVEPLTAAVVVSLFFSEAIKEGGKNFGKGVTETFTKLADTIRNKFKEAKLEGVLIEAENDPNEENKADFQKKLQKQMDSDEKFANQLKELVEQLKEKNEGVFQKILSANEATRIEAENLIQEAQGNGRTTQEAINNNKITGEIIVKGLTQKS
ncbi:hypothetical protein [Anabaena lutea]|uniref:Fis family transcriptional regulator n=1 Tax=Anabaena lutea FACHB-196 TaxID=2692881 RepID=A0ABR8FC12_9NOST|nr:hypothetical protein [Anabaena lutea]MBD2566737.1 hypothetical protein [Anabaena lutea FACHB-196]